MKGTIVDYQGDALQKKLSSILGPAEMQAGTCPIRNILDCLSDKWSTLSILNLGQSSPLRFNELKRRIDGISQRMLTVTLRNLERDGLVSRRLYPQIPPRVEYELTDLGWSFLAQIIDLGIWATEHSEQILTARANFATRKQELIASN